MAFPAQAQTTSICDRTPEVVDEILRLTSTKDDACDSVSVSEMAGISGFDFVRLNDKGLTSLQSGDFDGLTGLVGLGLENNSLTEFPAGIFSGLTNLTALSLANSGLTTLSSDVFSGLTELTSLGLHNNRLNDLPDGVFSGLTKLIVLRLNGNPGADFRLTVRFEPETLEEDFTAAPVRLVLREGAPRPVTVPLTVTGGSLMAGSPDSLTIARGSTQSDTVTVVKGSAYFRLGQGNLTLGTPTIISTGNYFGFEIVRGPPITVGGIRVKARVFLEGALE